MIFHERIFYNVFMLLGYVMIVMIIQKGAIWVRLQTSFAMCHFATLVEGAIMMI